MNRFRKILILAIIMAYTEFFGLINFDEDFRIPGGLKIHDLLNIILLAHLGFLVFNSAVITSMKLWHRKTFFLAGVYLTLVIGIAFSMKFRAPVGMVDTFKIARNFFPLFLFFYIWYDITVSGSVNFYKRTLAFIATGFSLIFITATIYPALITSFFPGLHVKMQTTSGFKMPRTYGYGFVFPYLFFIYQYVQYFLTRKIHPGLFLVNFIGVSVQGFRSYFFALFILIILINVLFANRQRIVNALAGLVVLFASLGTFTMLVGNEFLEDKVFSIFNEIDSDEGSFAGREQSDAIFRLPLLFKNPVWGIGFIHGESDYAMRLGSVYKDRDYMLYSTDSGIITMALMFGIAGSIIILSIFIRYLFQVFREVNNARHIEVQVTGITVLAYISMLLITIKTHGGLIYIYGLTPLVFILGVYAGTQTRAKLITKALYHTNANNSYKI